MSDYDPLYGAARRILLDALEALGSQRDAVIVVGAQAIYLRTGSAGLSVAPYTTDADLALSPARLTDQPVIDTVMKTANFEQEGDPGVWFKTVDVDGTPTKIVVDIMVPERVAPPGGRRSVRLPPHSKVVARRTIGLEGAIIDNDLMDVGALEGSDPRHFAVAVAGPAALLVAKLHKLRDRLGQGNPDRIVDKDAADIYRLMLATPPGEFVARLRPLLDDDMAQPVSFEAVELLSQHFGNRGSEGVRMAIAALRIAVPQERIAGVCTGFVRQTQQILGSSKA